MNSGHEHDAALAVTRHSGTGELLVLKRSEEKTFPGQWGFPGGYVEDGESPREAAERELEEETGKKAEVVDSGEPFSRQGTRGMYRMHPFLVAVNDRDVSLNEEHVEHRWVTVEELRGMKTIGDLEALENLGLV